MKRILLLLLLTAALFAQEKYFLPKSVTSSNGRPINNATVTLKAAGGSSTLYTLSYLSNSAGEYYYTSEIDSGTYDIYVNGKAWRTNFAINAGGLDIVTRRRVLGNTEVSGLDSTGLYRSRKNQRELLVEDYGSLFTPNDTSVDNSTAFEQIIDTAIARGWRRILIAEKYNIKNPIDIQGKDSISFIGITPHAGFTSTYRFPSDYASANYHEGIFVIDSTKGLVWENLNFDCNGAAWFPASQMHPLRFRSDDGPSSDIVIRNCYFDDCGNLQFRINSSIDTSVYNMRIENNTFNMTFGDCAIRFVAGAFDVLVKDNTCYGNDVGDSFILAPGASYHVVDGNIIHDTYDSGIYYSSGPVTITNNILYRPGKDGIKNVHNNAIIGRQTIISDNQVYTWGWAQGGVAYNYQGQPFVNNTFSNMDSTEARQAILSDNLFATWNSLTGVKHGQVQGLKVQGADVLVANNTGYGGNRIFSGQPGGVGISVTSGSYNVLVDGNQMVGWEKGIELGTNYRNVTIQNNHLIGQGFTSGGNAAVYVPASTGADSARNQLVIRGNTLNDWQRGFWINNADSVWIFDNISITAFNTGGGYDLIMNSSSNYLEQHNNSVIGRPVTMKPMLTDSIKIGISGGLYWSLVDTVNINDSTFVRQVTGTDTLLHYVRRP